MSKLKPKGKRVTKPPTTKSKELTREESDLFAPRFTTNTITNYFIPISLLESIVKQQPLSSSQNDIDVSTERFTESQREVHLSRSYQSHPAFSKLSFEPPIVTTIPTRSTSTVLPLPETKSRSDSGKNRRTHTRKRRSFFATPESHKKLSTKQKKSEEPTPSIEPENTPSISNTPTPSEQPNEIPINDNQEKSLYRRTPSPPPSPISSVTQLQRQRSPISSSLMHQPPPSPSPEMDDSPSLSEPPSSMIYEDGSYKLEVTTKSHHLSFSPPPILSPMLPECRLDDTNPYYQMALLPPLDKIKGRKKMFLPDLPPSMSQRNTLVLDLDETLLHCDVQPLLGREDDRFDAVFGERTHTIHVRYRPFLEAFIAEVVTLFEVVIFTASQAVYANEVLNRIEKRTILHLEQTNPAHQVYQSYLAHRARNDPNPFHILPHRRFRNSCIVVQGHYIKDLTCLGRGLDKVILVDNSPQAFGFQVDNGFPIDEFFDDEFDDQLTKVIPFLQALAEADDVRDLLRPSFHLSHYVNYCREQIHNIEIQISQRTFSNKKRLPAPPSQSEVKANQISTQTSQNHTKTTTIETQTPSKQKRQLVRDDEEDQNHAFQTEPMSPPHSPLPPNKRPHQSAARNGHKSKPFTTKTPQKQSHSIRDTPTRFKWNDNPLQPDDDIEVFSFDSDLSSLSESEPTSPKQKE
ncbi:putative Carboxy-terminal domain RNA polymerase II polypeptide A small phosphatase 1 [Blattamonas nauphoetae]|uniref:Carboxy-terminal domain RNA polymerase II polypeptide A small phosphatase 1 n=1 Tax=Blattamonas nauphoetae TaxID=2049346 RepID=A0ABQ9YHW6_9EUKA|nr:putative Carboxy-terminal domain RNA polymerase II polypeptide A small phosphatase 1 [Blattamonas nauphoetae]